MQTLKERRSRLHCRIPMELECLSCPTCGLHDAAILMVGRDGLYIETNHEMAPDEILRIHLLQKVSDELTWNRQLDNSVCVVRSSISKSSGSRYRYGTVARFDYALKSRKKTRLGLNAGAPSARRRVFP